MHGAMMNESEFTDTELLAYLDEALPVDRMTVVESAVRALLPLRTRLANLLARRDHGEHTLGEIWRRARLSCPSRQQLASCLQGTLDDAWADYIEFHVFSVGCRLCAANLEDLRQAAPAARGELRRRKFFDSSAGTLDNISRET